MGRNVRTRIAAGLVLLGFMSLSDGLAYAQTAPRPAPGKTIFDYKNELKLTDKQENQIRSILADLGKDIRLTNAHLTILNAELEDLIKKEGDLEQIRNKLKEASELQANIRYADVVATRQINNVLSAEQLKKWRSIQAAARQ